jgi:hypothetical protein
MTSRVLPVEEWDRLVGTELETLAPKLRPDDTEIVVVERYGELIGAWAVTRLVHVEGIWVAPSCRSNSSGVLRRLLAGMYASARRFGASFVWTGAESEGVASLARKVGGYRVEWDSYLLPVPQKGGR